LVYKSPVGGDEEEFDSEGDAFLFNIARNMPIGTAI
jgi:hypothetical protein